jgi:molybdopterin synthase catalytic subunit
MARLLTHTFDPEAALAAFRQGRHEAGALASFVGLVRANDDATTHLQLDHYPAFTLASMNDIETDATARFDVSATLVIHRAGLLRVGDPVVLVGALSAHRKPALECVDYLMDRLKTEAAFWKQEIGPSNQRTWIEPRPQDYASRQAWDQADND